MARGTNEEHCLFQKSEQDVRGNAALVGFINHDHTVCEVHHRGAGARSAATASRDTH